MCFYAGNPLTVFCGTTFQHHVTCRVEILQVIAVAAGYVEDAVDRL
jgi:hypothetical protein